MTPADFRDWRKRHKLTQRQAAETFGISHRTIQNIESGTSPIKPMLELACEAIDQRANVNRLWRDAIEATERAGIHN